MSTRCLMVLALSVVVRGQSDIPLYHPAYPDPSTQFAPGSLVDIEVRSCPLSATVRMSSRDFPALVSCEARLRVHLPGELNTGPAILLLQQDDYVYAEIPFEIVPTRFGFLSEAPTLADGRRMSLTRPAIAGATVTLRGTGLGHATATSIRALLDDQPLTLVSVGSSRQPGIDELRILIPQTLRYTGCYVPMQVIIDGSPVNELSFSVAQSSSPCRHPLGLSDEQLGILDSGRSIAVGAIDPDPYASNVNNPWASFQSANSVAVAAIIGPQTSRPRYSCSLLSTAEYGENLSAGEQAAHSSSPTQWTLQVRDGIDILGFSTSFTVPPMPRLRDSASTYVYGASQEIRLSWEPSAYSPQHEMTITVRSREIPYTILTCHAPAIAGFRTIPIGAILLAAPDKPRNWTAELTLGVAPHPGAQPTFRFPLRNGADAVGVVRFPAASTYRIQMREGPQ